jgi:hypothetical protein
MRAMKNLACLAMLAALLGGTVAGQSVADVARQNRHAPHKKATHVYDNDSLPQSQALPAPATQTDGSEAKTNEQKESSDKSEQAANESTDKAADKTKTPSKDAPADDLEAKKKEYEAAKGRIEEQKREIDLLQRELDVAKKEEEIQATTYYADAGTQLRDPRAWTEQAKKSQETIDAKTKALQDAKDKLDTTREDARKAGVPASYLE